MAGLGLDASNSKHEASGCVTVVRSERHRPSHFEARNDLSADCQPNAIPQSGANNCIVREGKPVKKRHTHVIRERERGRPGAALGTINDNEIRRDTGRQHRIVKRHEFPWMSKTELEANRFAFA